jgi:hypothetical protein
MKKIAFVLSALILCAQDSGFKPLFNGKDLTGWSLFKKSGSGYLVENGVLICPDDGGGNLLTNEEFSDFVFRFEFKLSPGGNNGVGIRAPMSGDIAYSGMEIQILDHDHEKYKGWLKPAQRHGSIYDVFPAQADALKPAGQWNQEEITAKGSKIKIVLNGKTLLDADVSTVTDPEVLKKHPGLQRKTGRIGFLGHNSRVEFRNISVKRL